MIDFKKLTQPVDTKNVDTGALLEGLAGQKVMIANIVVIVIALVVGYMMFNNYLSKKAQAEQSMNDLHHKLDTIASYKVSKKQFDDFKDSIPKAVDEDSLVNKLSDDAVQSNVEIVSFSPVTTSSFTYYDLASVDINVHAKGFKELVLFMQAVEKESMALRIENYRFGTFTADKGQDLALRVSTIKVKTQ